MARYGSKGYGGHSVGETPGPIPNPEAKTHSADGTAPGRVWESRSPPEHHYTVESPNHTVGALPHLTPKPPRRHTSPHPGPSLTSGGVLFNPPADPAAHTGTLPHIRWPCVQPSRRSCRHVEAHTPSPALSGGHPPLHTLGKGRSWRVPPSSAFGGARERCPG